MSLLGEVRTLRTWTPEDGELAKRISIGRIDRGAFIVAYFGGIEAWKIESRQVEPFFEMHPNTIWIVDRSKPIFLWLNFMRCLHMDDMIRRRRVIDLGLLYRLVHLAEYNDAADRWDLSFLATTYTQMDLETENGDFMPGIADAIEDATPKELTALERAIAAWFIFPWLWREAVEYSGEQRLLGYDAFLEDAFYQRIMTEKLSRESTSS